eukprot:1933838-Prymnesium_polylepis.1
MGIAPAPSDDPEPDEPEWLPEYVPRPDAKPLDLKGVEAGEVIGRRIRVFYEREADGKEEAADGGAGAAAATTEPSKQLEPSVGVVVYAEEGRLHV